MLVRSFKENKFYSSSSSLSSSTHKTTHKRFSISNPEGSKVLSITSSTTPPPLRTRKSKDVFTLSLSRRVGASKTGVMMRKAKRMSVGGVVGLKEDGVLDERRARTCSPPLLPSQGSTPSKSRKSKPLSSSTTTTTVTREVEMADPFPTNFAKFRLPTKLGRPASRPIRDEILAAVDPELVNVPLEYLKDVLAENGVQMLKSLSGAQIVPPRYSDMTTTIPEEIEVLIDPEAYSSVSEIPTHVLAIVPRKQPVVPPSSASTANAIKRVSLHLMHSVILATNCASLPTSFTSLLSKQPSRTIEESTNLTLPVIPLALPDPGSYGVLQGWMYTRSWRGLVGSLIPLPPASLGCVVNPPGLSSSSSFDPLSANSDSAAAPTPAPTHVLQNTHLAQSLAQTLARTYTPIALASFAQRIHGVWANACSLGVGSNGVGVGVGEVGIDSEGDEMFWMVIDFCWEVVREALRIGTGRNRDSNV